MTRTRISGTEENSGLLTALGIFGIGYLGYRLLEQRVVAPIQAKQFVERLQITAPKFGLDLKHKKAWISFVINNPNSNAMRIAAIVGHITMYEQDPKRPGFRIGDIDRFEPIVIKPLSAVPVTLTATIKAVNALAYMAKVLTGKWRGQVVNFQGTINANGRPWPVNETIKLSA
jgi:hypothetical protein